MEENKFNFIDGSPEQQKQAVDAFLNSLTDEEHQRAMSNEFDYLDEE